MKKRFTHAAIVLLMPFSILGQSDITFLQDISILQHLTHRTSLTLHSNPSIRMTSNGFHWGASIHNHFEITNFNTLAAAVALQKKGISATANFKISSLADMGYLRSAVAIGISIKLNKSWNGGTAIKLATFRLPENLGRSSDAGISIGINGRPTKKITCTLAGHYWQPVLTAFEKGKAVTHLNAGLYLQQSEKCTICISTAMMQGLEPSWMASVLLSPLPGVTLACGIGNGVTLLNVGLLFNMQGVAIGALSSFNPVCGRSHAVFISNYRQKND